MALFAKIDGSNNVVLYPYTTETFKTENPNTKAQADLATAYEGTEDAVANETSVVEIAEATQPDHTNRQNVEEADPALVDGVWTQVWNVVDKSADDIAAIDAAEASDLLRAQTAKRNNMLKSSDWTQLADAPITDAQKADYATWRQDLRDLTSHADWPGIAGSDWPADPHELVIVTAGGA